MNANNRRTTAKKTTLKKAPPAKPSVGKTIWNLVITILFAGLYFYIVLPAINFQDPMFYVFVIVVFLFNCIMNLLTNGALMTFLDAMTTQDDGSPPVPGEASRVLMASIKAYCQVPALIIIIIAAVVALGYTISVPVFRARQYRDLLRVEQSTFTMDVDEISFDQIPRVDDDSARRLGSRSVGELADVVSQYEIAQDFTQINYLGRPVRVTPLVYGDPIKWFMNRRTGIPGYILIDMVSQNTEVIRIPEVIEGETGIRYSNSEHFARRLNRHLRFSYPSYMFDHPNFEIDEDGVPYWVCPRLVKRIGLFGGRDIDGAVLMNAVTGESSFFLPDEIPSWVDRVYTSDLIVQQYDFYGKYQNGFFNSVIGQRDVTETTEGYNYIAFDDDVYMYTGITSAVTDDSIIGFILTNQRTKDTRFYAVAGATELSAADSAKGQVQHLNYDATFPILLNISDHPTYFMSLKDNAGLVKLYGMVNVNQFQIVATAETVAEVTVAYLDLMVTAGLSDVKEALLSEDDVFVSGAITDIRSAVISGNTRIYVRLQGSSAYFSIASAHIENAVLLNVGDVVQLRGPESDEDIRQGYRIVTSASR